MNENFIDNIEKVISKIDSISFKRVDEHILWVGATDLELNRTIDLSSTSLKIQIGDAMHYFEEEEEPEQNMSFFLRILNSEITEIDYFKGKKWLKTEYKIYDSKGIEDLGAQSSFLSFFYSSEDRKTSKIHPQVLNKELYDELKQELKKMYSM